MAKSYIHLQYPHSCLSARFAVYHILASVLLPKISSSVLLFVAFSHLLVLFYLELRYAVIGKSNLFLSTSSFSSSLSYFSSNTSYLVFLSFPRSGRVLESCMVGPFSPLKSQGEMYNFHPLFSLSWDVSVRGQVSIYHFYCYNFLDWQSICPRAEFCNTVSHTSISLH